MNDDQFDDLKQFIESTVSQSEQRIRQDLGGRIDNLETDVAAIKTDIGEMKTEMHDIKTEMRDGFAGVGDALAPLIDQQEDHKRRITKLESHAA